MIVNNFDKIGETLYCETLPNGLQIIVDRKKGFKLGYAVFATKYGGAFRRFKLGDEWHDTPAGVAHFLEHKMFDMPDGDNALNVLSANGAQPNAFTSSGITAYYFDCTQKFHENLRMLLKFVSTPYFTPESVQKEQGIIGQEIGMVEDSVGYVVYNRLMRMLYAHNPVRDQVAGTVESIAEISSETLYNCHAAFYAPSNMVLCVAGDFDPQEIFDIAEEMLPAEKAEIPETDFGEKESEYPLEAYHEENMEVSAPQFYIGAKLTPAEGASALQRQKIVATLAMRTVFGSSSAFYNRLYADGLLNRDYEYEVDYTAGTATILIGGESREPQKVLEEIKAEIKSVAEIGIDKAAFNRAKKASFGARLRGLEDFDSLCVSLATSAFDGYCGLDAFEILTEIDIKECEDFLTYNMSDAKLAMSVLNPIK